MTALLTVAEAAALLKCSRRTVFAEIQRGKLRCRHVGRGARITEGDLEEYLKCASDGGSAAFGSTELPGSTDSPKAGGTGSARDARRSLARSESSKRGRATRVEITGPDLRDVAAAILKER